jgi:uncharacterized damage-inducible protein DinB
MAHALHDPVRHNAWATTQILEFCRERDEQTLNATVPGAYGSILATLRHIMESTKKTVCLCSTTLDENGPRVALERKP